MDKAESKINKAAAAPIARAKPSPGGQRHIELTVGGMTSVHCLPAVEKAIDGVASAHVNLANKLAAFDCDPDRVAAINLAKAIRAAGYALQTSQKLESIILDKTGTITRGEPALTDVVVAQGQNDNAVLRLAASLVEQGSERSLSEAIVRGADQRGLSLAATENFGSIPGHGMSGRVDGHAAGLVAVDDTVKPDSRGARLKRSSASASR